MTKVKAQQCKTVEAQAGTLWRVLRATLVLQP